MRPLWAQNLRADLWETRPQTLRGLIELVRAGDREQRDRLGKNLASWLRALEAAGEIIELSRNPTPPR